MQKNDLSEPLNPNITMKKQEFPECILFEKYIHFHISYPKKAEDGEPSNELKIQGLDFKSYTIPLEMKHDN